MSDSPTTDSAAFASQNFSRQQVAQQVEGKRYVAASPRALLADDDDLTACAPWAAAGYAVLPGLAAESQQALRAGLAELLRAALRGAGCPVSHDFDPACYHHVVASDQDRHLAVIAQTKAYQLAELPVDPALLEALVGAACGRAVRAYNPLADEAVFHLRIVRPGQADHNPVHRDAWLPRYRNCLNIYLPVAGSTASSALTLMPGSHYWPEDTVARTAEGARYHGVPYTVPGLLDSVRPIDLVRPNPGPGQVLVFSPYLLHGGAANLNADATRVSLEMRFWAAT